MEQINQMESQSKQLTSPKSSYLKPNSCHQFIPASLPLTDTNINPKDFAYIYKKEQNDSYVKFIPNSNPIQRNSLIKDMPFIIQNTQNGQNLQKNSFGMSNGLELEKCISQKTNHDIIEETKGDQHELSAILENHEEKSESEPEASEIVITIEKESNLVETNIDQVKKYHQNVKKRRKRFEKNKIDLDINPPLTKKKRSATSSKSANQESTIVHIVNSLPKKESELREPKKAVSLNTGEDAYQPPINHESSESLKESTPRRPKRNVGRKNYSEIDDKPILQMQDCFKYRKFEEKAQPFEIYMSLECLLLMNIHSHLTQNEIIGFVGGQIIKDSQKNKTRLFIQSAYPCDSIETAEEDLTINVEMEPESEAIAKEKIESNHQKILGWYHSHATFEVSPSDVDIRNQSNFQKLFSLDGIEFFGIIIGPYNHRVKEDCISDMKYYHVNDMKPFELRATFFPQKLLSDQFFNAVNILCSMYNKKPSKIKFNDKWRKSAHITLYHKLLSCIRSLFLHNQIYFEEGDFKHAAHLFKLLESNFPRDTLDFEFEMSNYDPNYILTRICNRDKTLENRTFLEIHNDKGLEDCIQKIDQIFAEEWSEKLLTFDEVHS